MSMAQSVPGHQPEPESATAAVDPGFDHQRELQERRAATYTGRDPDNLASAVVDHEGTVVAIRLATTIDLHPVTRVESAVRAAIVAAQQEMDDAWAELAARVTANTGGEQ